MCLDENESHNIQHVAETLEKWIRFSSAARWYIESFSERSGIHEREYCDFARAAACSTGTRTVPHTARKSCNVHRHSHSASVDIQLEFDANELILEIIDHGQGIPPESLELFRSKARLRGGVGLRSMSGRIRELGGSFEIESDKEGTLIRVAAPIPESSTMVVSAACEKPRNRRDSTRKRSVQS